MTTRHRPTRCTARRAAGAFTLLELLTVIVIIGLLSAVIVPTIAAMTRGGRVEAGMNTLGAAVSVARALIWRDAAMIEDLPSGTGAWAQAPNGYSGIALLVTAREIRFVENYGEAVDDPNPTNATALALTNTATDPWDRPRYRNAFRDIEGLDDIRLPSGVGIAGISRGNNGLMFLAPPFAIRFDAAGRMIHGRTTQDRWVFYRSTGNTTTINGAVFDVIDLNPSNSVNNRIWADNRNLDPDEWDPSSPEYAALPVEQRRQKWVADAETGDPTRKLALPFEGVDTVLGVVIYDKNKFRQLFDGDVQEGWPAFQVASADVDPDLASQPDYEDAVAAFLLREGRMVFFNRYTGTLVSR